MALSIKTEKADRLARYIAGRRGWTMTQVVENALERDAEALDREETTEAFVARIKASIAEAKRATSFDTRPFTQAEADWAGGDDVPPVDHPWRA